MVILKSLNYAKSLTPHRSERVSGTSKTLKISTWVESAPKICPREARTKCTHLNAAVVRHDTSRSLTRKQAISRTQSGCLVHTDPRHGSRTAEAHSMRISEAQSCPNSCNVRIKQEGPQLRLKGRAHDGSHCPGHYVRSQRTLSPCSGCPGRLVRHSITTRMSATF